MRSGLRRTKRLSNGESRSAVAWLQGYCFSSQYLSSIELVPLRIHPRTSSRSAERLCIAAQICTLPHGRPRIAAQLPWENLCGVSVEKGKFSVSHSVHMYVWCIYVCIIIHMYVCTYAPGSRWEWLVSCLPVQVLICMLGADPNAVNPMTQWTPLHYAAATGCQQTLR